MSEETTTNQQPTVTIPGLTSASAAYADMILPVSRGTGDYGLSIALLAEFMQGALSPITAAERQKLQGLENVPADWSGTQAQYDALESYDPARWYFVVESNAVVAVYRGSTLIHATANLVGQFADDSVPEDWYWWPNGIKTALPVDPVTKRFATYYTGSLETTNYLFAGGSSDNAFTNNALIRLERIPRAKSYDSMGWNLHALEVWPMLDCAEIAPKYNIYYTLNYVIGNTSKAPRDLYFRNTEKITQMEMTLNNGNSETPTRIWGLDLSAANSINTLPFGAKTCLIQAVNFGKAQSLTTANMYAGNWGNDTMSAGARQSVIDTLLTNSFDRSAAGYDPVTVLLSDYTVSVLTADELAAITAKGYTISSCSTPPITTN